MGSIDNLDLLPAARELDRRDAEQSRYDEAHARLKGQLSTAITQGLPSVKVETPGFGEPWTSASEVLLDHFAGRPEDFAALLYIVGRATASTDADLSAAAVKWRDRMAKEHADFHAPDALWRSQ